MNAEERESLNNGDRHPRHPDVFGCFPDGSREYDSPFGTELAVEVIWQNLFSVTYNPGEFSMKSVVRGVGLFFVMAAVAALLSEMFFSSGSLSYAAQPSSSAVSAFLTAADGDVVPVEESMHEFMEYVFQPTYIRLKKSMAAAPEDNAGWKGIKSDSLILAESCNLLYGRKPAEHGEDWVKHAAASKAGGAALYKAARAKDFAAASTAWKTMLESCNACHKQFENGKHILQP
jgi:hypothetical protein